MMFLHASVAHGVCVIVHGLLTVNRPMHNLAWSGISINTIDTDGVHSGLSVTWC